MNLWCCLQVCSVDSRDCYLTKDEISELLYDDCILHYTSLDIYLILIRPYITFINAN